MTKERPSSEQLASWLKVTSHSPHTAESTVSLVLAQLRAKPQQNSRTVEGATSRIATVAFHRPRTDLTATLVAAVTVVMLAAGVLGLMLLSSSPEDPSRAVAPGLVATPTSSGDGSAPSTMRPAQTATVDTPTAQKLRPDGILVAPGAMEDAGSMAMTRRNHTATRLADGRVVILGGQGGGHLRLSRVDLWDPATRRFDKVGELLEPRNGHTATLLDDGRVLVMGGLAPTPPAPIASVEVWDPATSASTETDALRQARAFHTATLLPDGRVLIVGGRGIATRHVVTAEIWDPAIESTTWTGNLNEAREAHTATLLPDGRVLIVGGYSRSVPTAETEIIRNYLADGVTASIEIWDPATDAFTQLEPLGEPRFQHSATALSDGRVLIAGGGDAFEQGTSSVEIWDPLTQATTPTGSLEWQRYGHTATALADDRVLLVGGDKHQRAEIWDPRSGLIARAGITRPARRYHSATLLPGNRVLVVGGKQVSSSRRNPGPLASAQVWESKLTTPTGEAAARVVPETTLGGDRALAGRFPAQLGGDPLEVRTMTGAEWLDQYDPSYPTDAAYREEIERFASIAAVEVEDLSLATALYEQNGNHHAIAGLRVRRADATSLVDPAIELMLGQIVEPVVEWIEFGGKPVAKVRDASMPGAYPSYVYPDGEVIWLVQAEEPILSEIFAALP